MTIRKAAEADVESILKIYEPYITEQATSFELTLPSLKDFHRRFQAIAEKFPWFVAEHNGVITGYAYASAHRERAAYQWSCEVSVYLDSRYHKRGIGRQLYTTLFQELKTKGFRNALAGITLPNEPSEKIHKAMGFELIGVYKNIGQKFDKWHDVAWYQLEL